MLKLNAQTMQKNGMGVAWMLAHNGKEIPVQVHVYGAIGELDENAAAAIWMIKYAPYDKLVPFLKQFVAYTAVNQVPYTDNRDQFNADLAKELSSGGNLGKQVGWSKEQTADYLLGLVKDMSIDEIYDLGDTVTEHTGDFVAKDLNETFIRVRMGGEYDTDKLTGDTFFRIGSTYKDWTNAIYMFVHEHKNVTKIYVERDAESDGKTSLTERDVMINGMSREEFLSAEKLPFLGSRHDDGIMATIYKVISNGNYSDLAQVKANSSRVARLCDKLRMENISCNYKTIQAPWASKPKNRKTNMK